MSVARRDERGFTLPEVLVVIAILGILLAIAVIVWLGILEQRRVDAAINQLAADLRLAHTSATNQLTDWRVVYTEGSGNYELRRLSAVCDDDNCSTPSTAETISRTLPSGTMIHPDSSNDLGGPGGEEVVELNSDGTGRALSGPNATIVVSSTDNDPKRQLTFVSATSRIKVVP
jgi:prepilin-type N-terminal cleavage/methylation domain-containing protein